ncbi:MAG: hypothetical protein QM757_41420 [Paludibaculum sp.]
MLFFAIQSVIPRRMTRPAQLLLWLSLITYLVVVGYSVTYNPYHADLASPATQDTLFVVCFLGFVRAFSEGRQSWLALWTIALYTCWPSGLMLAGFWCLAAWMVGQQRPKRQVIATAATLVACMLAGRALGYVLPVVGIPRPGGEHGWASLLEERLNVYQIGALLRLRFVWDPIFLKRWLWVSVPAGILPFACLAFWRRQDEVSRALTLTIAGYFLFFYTQALVHVHYFVPVMLLPLVVYWRMEPDSAAGRRVFYLATAATGVIALVLSWPAQARPFLATRSIGSTIECRLPGYDRQEPRVYNAFRLFLHAIPGGWEEGVPERRFGVLPDVWVYYAHRSRLPGVAINYVLTGKDQPAPPGSTMLAANEDAALYVLDPGVMEAQRGLRLPDRPGSWIYQAPRWTMLKKQQPLSETLVEIRRRLGF